MDCKCLPWNVKHVSHPQHTTGGAQFGEDDADNSGAGQSVACPPGYVLVGSDCLPQSNAPQSIRVPIMPGRPAVLPGARRPSAIAPPINGTYQEPQGPHIAEEPFPWALMAAAFAGVWILTSK